MVVVTFWGRGNIVRGIKSYVQSRFGNPDPNLTCFFWHYLALLPLKIDCEAFSGTDPQREAAVMVEAPLEDQGKIEWGAVVPATPSPSQTSNVTTIPSSQDILNLIASKYLNSLNPSAPEDFNSFVRYMKEVREVILVDCKPGSLIITVECRSLNILEELWQDYCTLNLSRVVQQYLVTEDVLKELGLTEVKLTTTIDEEDYRACLKHFKRGKYKSLQLN